MSERGAWGDEEVGKILTMQTCGFKFSPLNSYQKMCAVVHIFLMIVLGR